jgi:hypothetical protein
MRRTRGTFGLVIANLERDLINIYRAEVVGKNLCLENFLVKPHGYRYDLTKGTSIRLNMYIKMDTRSILRPKPVEISYCL